MRTSTIQRVRLFIRGSTSGPGAPLPPRRVWLLAFLAFALLGAAWSLAMPYDGPADELQHVLRAYAVWSGQVRAPADGLIRAPQSLMPDGLHIGFSCFRWNHAASAHCAATAGADPAQTRQMIETSSNAATYSPVYYALVGWPIRIWPTFFGIIAARLLTTVFMSAFIAFAVTAASRLRHARWLLPGLLVVLTPVVVNLEGGVNPAGPEIVVGLALWVALIGIVDARQASPGLVRLACVSGAFLAVFRSFGVEWLVLTVGVAVFGGVVGWLRHPRRVLSGLDRGGRGGRGWVRAVLANRTLLRWLPVTGVGLVFGYVWVKLTGGVGNLAAGSTAGHLTLAHAYVDELWSRTTYYTDGFIALTSYGDVPTPGLVFYVWFGVCAALILLALAVSGTVDRLRIVGIILGAYVILIYPDAETVAHGWWLSQGRYALPFIVGAPLLAAHALGEQRVLIPQHLRKVTRMVGLVLLPIQGVMLYVTMIRFESGGAHLDVLHGKWLPPLGPELPLLLCAAGIVVAWCLVVRMSSLPVNADPSPTTDETQPTAARLVPQPTGPHSAMPTSV
ncbi:MAG TPA: DUF2142 domain-containing protein [Actinocrinis sp.]|nr:DUF2142 domain-containing protein [Actinocrinis sp.]